MKIQTILLLIVVSFPSACVSLREHGAATSKPLSSVDCEFHFSSIGLPIPHITEYTITRDAKIRQVDDDSGRLWLKKRTSTRRVTAEGWQKFQKTLAKLDVYHWKPAYSPRQQMYDGYGWELRISNNTRTVQSRGGNAGPSPTNPARTISCWEDKKPSADTLLERALEDLWKASR